VNNNLKETRLKRGMSISELARRTGLSRVAITNIENGRSNPLETTIHSISVALEKEPHEIFFKQSVIQELQK